MILGSLAVKALLPSGPGAASRDRAAGAPASLDRRKMLSVFAASVFPAGVYEASAAMAPAAIEAPPATSTLPSKQTTDWTRADYDWDSVGRPAPPPAPTPSPLAPPTLTEQLEEMYTPQSGLAKLALTVEQASQLVDKLELEEKLEQLQYLVQLQGLLRSPFMVSFLGYEPYEVVEVEPMTVKTSRTKSGPPVAEQLGDPRILETQLTFLNSFPESNRRQAAEGLSGFFSQVRLPLTLTPTPTPTPTLTLTPTLTPTLTLTLTRCARSTGRAMLPCQRRTSMWRTSGSARRRRGGMSKRSRSSTTPRAAWSARRTSAQ